MNETHVHQFRRYFLVDEYGTKVWADSVPKGAWYTGYECTCGEQGYAA